MNIVVVEKAGTSVVSPKLEAVVSPHLRHLEVTLAITFETLRNWSSAILMASLAQHEILRAIASRTIDNASEQFQFELHHLEALSKSAWVGDLAILWTAYNYQQHNRSEAQARDALVGAIHLAMCPVEYWLSAMQGIKSAGE